MSYSQKKLYKHITNHTSKWDGLGMKDTWTFLLSYWRSTEVSGSKSITSATFRKHCIMAEW